MTLHILSQQNTVLNKFIAEIRDKRIQRDSMRFRRNMERIGEITAYEISKAFSYKPCVVETPLGEATVEMIDEQIVVATILRAGLPIIRGFSTTSTTPRTPSSRPIARAPRTASSP